MDFQETFGKQFAMSCNLQIRKICHSNENGAFCYSMDDKPLEIVAQIVVGTFLNSNYVHDYLRRIGATQKRLN